jgi:hypothetical protein
MTRSPLPKAAIFAVLIALATVLVPSCSLNTPAASTPISSRSYSGHTNDQDANNLVRAYPAIVSTRLDDCQTCHSAGLAGTSTGTGPKAITNACAYCHLKAFPDSVKAGGYTTGVPAAYSDTLNPFGKAYLNAGRSIDAFTTIASFDSDMDNYSNSAEIAAGRFPGNASSYPGQPLAPTKVLTYSQVASLSQHSQFLLMNASKQQYDFYATYEGPTVKDLLAAAGVDSTDPNITSVSMFAPDGFKQDFTIAKVNIKYPDGIFRTVPGQPFSNSLLDFVQYPATLPTGLVDGSALTGQWLTMAIKRDGGAMATSYYDTTTCRQEGEGPFRVIPPQTTPGRPDRGSGLTQANPDDGWNYLSTLDHNAGSSERGVVVIRINPMPSGYEEFDTSNGWSLISDKKLVIYGYGIH